VASWGFPLVGSVWALYTAKAYVSSVPGRKRRTAGLMRASSTATRTAAGAWAWAVPGTALPTTTPDSARRCFERSGT
jgi:hypothetical protein